MSITEHEHATEIGTGREQRARTLEAAALEIEVNGWTQGTYEDEQGRFCAMGACAAVLGIEYGSDFAAAMAAIMETWDVDWRDQWSSQHGYRLPHLLPLAVWNDREGRQQSDVTFLLRWRAEEIRDGW